MKVEDALKELPLIAIIRGVTPDEAVGIGEALFSAGIRVVEVPLNSPEPLESIRRLSAFEGRMAWGAGTVLTPAAVDQVKAAGGQLVVSPNTDAAVIQRTLELGMTPMPGFGSASETFAAVAAGAKWLKLFPASTYGPGHLKALKEVLPPEVVLQPVGGVRAETMAEWWKAGARGFGLGGELYRPGMTAEEVERRAQNCVKALRNLLES
jgi:2-dehydro-3-deoxyphosphogalactonate aldolase